MSFDSRYGLGLGPVLRRLIPWGDIKPTAARLGVSVPFLRRCLADAAPFPAALVGPLALAIGRERGDDLLSAVLGGAGIAWRRLPAADPDIARMTGLRPATDFDRVVAAFEEIACAVEGGRAVDADRIQMAGDRVHAFISGWVGRLQDQARRQPCRAASQSARARRGGGGGDMKIEIKSWYTGKVLFSVEAGNIKATLEIAAGQGANLAGADLTGAHLAGANLTGAYLASANLASANLAGADLTGAYLASADLAGAHLAGADLTGAYLAHANLAGADLTGAHLAHANLAGVNFCGADLTGVDIPVVLDLHRRIEEATRSEGTLCMGTWHTCVTTHCRAGWAITLAGDAGRALEAAIGPCAAGALIYHVSTGMVPDFFANTEDARADIVRCAEQAAAAGGAS